MLRDAGALASERRRPVLHGLVLGLIVIGAFISFFASQAFPFQVNERAAITGLSLPGLGASPPEEFVLVTGVLPDTVRREELADGLAQISGLVVVESDASAAAVAVSEPALVAQLPYEFYTVQEGDTASGIAARFGIDLQYLLWANSHLRDGEFLATGKTLIVPLGNGILHDVRYGETLSDIALRYGVAVEAILAWESNVISSADQVIEDQLIFVPGGALPVAVLPVPTALPTDDPVLVEAPPIPVPAPAPPDPVVTSGGGLIWPVSGPVSSYMDGSHPLGIDIDLFHNPNAAIGAATSGTVTFAGGAACCSYGLYVVIMSPDGIETLYAHFSSIAVSVGQEVSQGTIVGYAGCTGYCTGNHLHFEVIDNGVRVNPISYLP